MGMARKGPAQKVQEVEEQELKRHESFVIKRAFALAPPPGDYVDGSGWEDGEGDEEDEKDGSARRAQGLQEREEGGWVWIDSVEEEEGRGGGRGEGERGAVRIFAYSSSSCCYCCSF